MDLFGFLPEDLNPKLKTFISFLILVHIAIFVIYFFMLIKSISSTKKSTSTRIGEMMENASKNKRE